MIPKSLDELEVSIARSKHGYVQCKTDAKLNPPLGFSYIISMTDNCYIVYSCVGKYHAVVTKEESKYHTIGLLIDIGVLTILDEEKEKS